MLDQKLIRENPAFVEKNLSLRGKVFNINYLNKLALDKKEIDTQISILQSESKKLSKLIGQEIKNNNNSSSKELKALKVKGNNFRIKISELEDESNQFQNNLEFFSDSSSDNPLFKNVSTKIRGKFNEATFFKNSAVCLVTPGGVLYFAIELIPK